MTGAEMIKYASNAFLATKISYINELANLWKKLVLIFKIFLLMGLDQRIGDRFWAGLPMEVHAFLRIQEP